MSVSSKLTKRNQTTLPAEVRKRLRAEPGDTLEYDLTDEGVFIRVKRPDLGEVLKKYLGVFGGEGYENEEEALKQARELRGWDEEDIEVFTRWNEE